MSGAIDLSQLPAPTIIETLDFDTTLEKRKAEFVALFPAEQQSAVAAALALESDPSAKHLEHAVYLENLLRQRINEAALANMLAYATRSDLDNLAARRNLSRRVITPADNTTTPPTPAVMESDDALRLRVQLSMDTLSVAGPTGAYEGFALSADGKVLDAKAISPAPACVTVTILSTDGDGTASQDLLDTVTRALSDRERRPVADRLTVQSVEIVPYEIDAVLVLSDGPQSAVVQQQAEQRIAAYNTDRHKIGRDVNREKIVGVLNSDGVENIILNAPAADMPVGNTQAAYCSSVRITVISVSDDGGSSD